MTLLRRLAFLLFAGLDLRKRRVDGTTVIPGERCKSCPEWSERFMACRKGGDCE